MRSLKRTDIILVTALAVLVALIAAFAERVNAQVVHPVPVATPIVIAPPVANPPSITSHYPTPAPAAQSINLRAVPVLSIPNFSQSSLANSRAAKKALLQASLLPFAARGEQSTVSGTAADVQADMERTYAARVAETAAHQRLDGAGQAVRLRAAPR